MCGVESHAVPRYRLQATASLLSLPTGQNSVEMVNAGRHSTTKQVFYGTEGPQSKIVLREPARPTTLASPQANSFTLRWDGIVVPR